jgi:competence ComEA-like helix-hairpin-helix protein
MKNAFRKIAIAVVIVAAVVYAVIFNVIRENSVNETIPAVNTVYYGGDYFIAGENVSPETANTQTAYTSNNVEETAIGFTLVKINTAETDELMKLPGIGEVTALAIIDYRIANGNFAVTSDIKNVKGIGDAKFEAIKDFITVGEVAVTSESTTETATDNSATETADNTSETAADTNETADTTESADGTTESADNTTETAKTPAPLINLNTASLEELMTINGGGEATAAKILAYRSTYGFKDVADLLLIDGIGEAKYNAIAPYVIV